MSSVVAEVPVRQYRQPATEQHTVVLEERWDESGRVGRYCTWGVWVEVPGPGFQRRWFTYGIRDEQRARNIANDYWRQVRVNNAVPTDEDAPL